MSGILVQCFTTEAFEHVVVGVGGGICKATLKNAQTRPLSPSKRQLGAIHFIYSFTSVAIKYPHLGYLNNNGNKC